MAYTIEAHSHDAPRTPGGRGGTRELLVGGRSSLVTASDALGMLMRLKTMGTWVRAYVIHQDIHQVVCVWARDNDDTIHCVGHTAQFRVQDSPPYLYEGRTKVVTQDSVYNFRTIADRDNWVGGELGKTDVGTATLLRSGRLHSAWEIDRATGLMILVASGPQSVAGEPYKYSAGSRRTGYNG